MSQLDISIAFIHIFTFFFFFYLFLYLIYNLYLYFYYNYTIRNIINKPENLTSLSNDGYNYYCYSTQFHLTLFSF